MLTAVQHGGVTILQADLRGAPPEEYVQRLEEASRQLEAHPEGSIRLLVFSTGMHCPFASANAMKAFLLRNRPRVVATAVVGLSAVKRSLVSALVLTAKVKARSFDDADAARAWLSAA